MSLLVKVCGMTLPEQVQAIDGLGADFLGFIFAGKSPRKVSPEHVAAIPRGRARRVGVFVEQDADEVRRIMDAAGLDYAQLHGGQNEAFCRSVGPQRIIKVFWPQKYAVGQANSPAAQVDKPAPDGALEALQRDMNRFSDLCHLMLLDSGVCGGGHGRSLDFAALAGLAAPRPWLLAGGLSPDNAGRAAREARPAGLDLNSGVETAPGVKDLLQVEKTIRILKSS